MRRRARFAHGDMLAGRCEIVQFFVCSLACVQLCRPVARNDWRSIAHRPPSDDFSQTAIGTPGRRDVAAAGGGRLRPTLWESSDADSRNPPRDVLAEGDIRVGEKIAGEPPGLHTCSVHGRYQPESPVRFGVEVEVALKRTT